LIFKELSETIKSETVWQHFFSIKTKKFYFKVLTVKSLFFVFSFAWDEGHITQMHLSSQYFFFFYLHFFHFFFLLKLIV